MNDYNKYYAGAISGIIEVILNHPIDYLKVKKQEHIQNNLKGNFYRKILRENKINMYKGITPRLLGIIPIRFTFWGVQDNLNNYMKNKNYSKLSKGLIIGFGGGFCQTIVENPIEIYKINKMSNKNICIFEAIKNNYGFTANLIRNIGFASSIGIFCLQNRTESNITNFFLSAFAGTFGSIVTHPFDYIKTFKQRTKSKKNTIIILKDNLKKNPYKLYTGLSNRIFLNFFAMGIGFTAYDNIYKFLDNLK